MVEPDSDFDVQIAFCKFLQGEQTKLPRNVGWNEGFGANRFEIAGLILDAARPAPSALFILHKFGAGLKALAVKDGADLLAFKFGMGIIGIARTQAQFFE